MILNFKYDIISMVYVFFNNSGDSWYWNMEAIQDSWI